MIPRVVQRRNTKEIRQWIECNSNWIPWRRCFIVRNGWTNDACADVPMFIETVGKRANREI